MHKYLISEHGASAAEYAVLLSILGGAVAMASLTLGNSISQSLQASGDLIASAGSSGKPGAGGNGNGQGDSHGNGGGAGQGLGGGNGNGQGKT